MNPEQAPQTPPTGPAYDLAPPVEVTTEATPTTNAVTQEVPVSSTMITVPEHLLPEARTEAFVPSREPVTVESRAVPLTDAQVASMSEGGAVIAAQRGGADPAEALARREEAIRSETEAAQRIIESQE